jgi:nucleoside-diphosphate-sugar epimerase
MSERLRVAILGATGHVGKVLADGLATTHELTLYARRPAVAAAFADALGLAVAIDGLDNLASGEHDSLVNCIGVGDPAAVAADPALVYRVTQAADDLALTYLAENPGCTLVNFSSGAAYCSEFAEPADDDTRAALRAADLRADQHYGLAKLASEGRHRAESSHGIIDLRLFSLFSRHIDVGSAFMMNDVVRCLRSGETLATGSADNTRDYVAPADLCALVGLSIGARDGANLAVDVFSSAPVAKFELLDAMRERFGLRYVVEGGVLGVGATGAKPKYYSLSRKAAQLGYAPSRTSLEALVQEVETLLATTR